MTEWENGKMKRTTIIAAALLALAGPAWADQRHVTLGADKFLFVDDYASWSALSDDERAVYAAAVFDQFIADSPTNKFLSAGELQEMYNCIRNLRATAASIARLISNRYAKVPAERLGGPAAVLTGYFAAGDFCGELTSEMKTGQQ
jgi:hypothetical protein